jgi:hypothetical protein
MMMAVKCFLIASSVYHTGVKMGVIGRNSNILVEEGIIHTKLVI